ncbi:MAG: hypothetical protein HOK52_00780 [Candidatus Marinimicrobia bacterium]|jgi:hypothetical protein|nr:hypothetical protein [Candidatus Neomarinimicrobiota bacterium]
MGLADFFERRLRKKMKKIATKSARVMLWSANLNRDKAQPPHEFAKLAIQGRNDYYINNNNTLICFGNNTGFIIDENTTIADVIEFVVMLEFKNNPVLLNYPIDHQERSGHIRYSGSVAREYVTRKVGF